MLVINEAKKRTEHFGKVSVFNHESNYIFVRDTIKNVKLGRSAKTALRYLLIVHRNQSFNPSLMFVA